MKSIRFTKKPRLKNPVLISAWPGMGDVALKAAIYLKDHLKAEEFGTMASNDYFHPTGVWIESGIVEPPQNPSGKFYFYKNPKGAGASDVVLFISDAQPYIEKGHAYADEIIESACELKIKMVYTFAAMPLPIEHTQVPGVHAVATDKEKLASLEKLGLKAMPTGQISGLNGLILGSAKAHGLQGACLLAEIPLYTIQIENPLASMAVLEILSKIVGIEVDFTDLQKHAALMNQEIEHLIEYLKNPPEEDRPIGQEEIDVIKKSLADASGLPDSARSHIDDLFRLAKKDLSKAVELKRELDKWNVYEKYEDAFLDLFKKTPLKKNN
jgi:proteasome assembly chaperone (PAC2) family protein